jgi:hypothetical protein
VPTNKIALIHGYSDQGSSFQTWAGKLQDRGFDAKQINICNYVSLNNEITIPDIGEGLNRAIQDVGWGNSEFDAIVHSTGMLVIRAYLCNDSARPQNLKHLVGLAPATWGSPLASEGRSFLGTLFRGNRQLGPDFLNAGDLILEGLELGGDFTWNLAHRDLLGKNPIFSTAPDTPWVSVFIGNTPYTGIRELLNQPATDGTVRWAGCSLNTRKFVVDLRRGVGDDGRIQAVDWAKGRLSIPMFAVDGKNHGSLLSDPENDLADLVAKFLSVSTASDMDTWTAAAKAWNEPALQKMKNDRNGPNDGWQQFVFHLVDEYGNGVPDYVVDFFKDDPTGLEGEALDAITMNEFDLDVHAYGPDKSYRCFHVSLPKGIVLSGAGDLWLRLTASSGSDLIAYQGYAPGKTTITEASPVLLDISKYADPPDSIFCPFTTTLVEIIVNREPVPFDKQSRLLTMAPYAGRTPAAGAAGGTI